MRHVVYRVAAFSRYAPSILFVTAASSPPWSSTSTAPTFGLTMKPLRVLSSRSRLFGVRLLALRVGDADYAVYVLVGVTFISSSSALTNPVSLDVTPITTM